MIQHLMITFLMLATAQATPSLKDAQFSGGAKIKLEVAESHEARAKGLMGRTHLPDNQGMLFQFEFPHRLTFWMKDTFIPLSIAFLDQDRVIKEIHEMKAQNMMERDQDLQSYISDCDCQYALEVNQGWFKKHKVKVGDRLDLRPE